MLVYTTKQVPVTEISDTLCDVCGASTKSMRGTLEYATLTAAWEDGNSISKHICRGCSDQLVSGMVS